MAREEEGEGEERTHGYVSLCWDCGSWEGFCSSSLFDAPFFRITTTNNLRSTCLNKLTVVIQSATRF